jgi:hypothetical protein
LHEVHVTVPEPAVTVPPAQSMTVAPAGTRTSARRPTSVMSPFRMTTTPSPIAVTSGATCTRPPTSAVTLSATARGASVVAGPQAPINSAMSSHPARCLIAGDGAPTRATPSTNVRVTPLMVRPKVIS